MKYKTRFLIACLIMSMFVLSSCEVYNQIYNRGSTPTGDVTYIPIEDIVAEKGEANLDNPVDEVNGENAAVDETTDEVVEDIDDENAADDSGFKAADDSGFKGVDDLLEDLTDEETTDDETEVVDEEALTAKEEPTVPSDAIVISVSETQLVSLKPKAADPDADTVKYLFTSPLDDNGKWQTKYGDAGEYTITVTASDGELTTSKAVLLIINKKEEAPVINSFTPKELSLKSKENSELVFSVSASDLNKDELIYSWKLDGKEVSTETKYTYDITYDDAGKHTLTVSVSDGASPSEKVWAIDVENVNRAPVLAKISDLIVKEKETVKIDPEATDPDGDEIKFTISDPVGDDGVWETTYDSSGEYTVKVTASDGTTTVSQDVNVKVTNVNRAPVIEDIVLG